MTRVSLFAILCVLLAGARADEPSDKPAATPGETKTESKTATKTVKEEPEALPPLSTTEHKLTVNGRTLHYRAVAGYLPQRNFDEAKIKANVFFIAYTLLDAPVGAQRPVTFAFNGGPGSSSIWLHMGALGPKRVAMTPEGDSLAPPYKLVDNGQTWLDETDLVFIDPVGTGYSRAVKGEDKKQFFGYKEDLESIGDFIRLYTTRYKRWASPKFVIGESYGGARAAGLSEYLQDRYGLYCNGIILVSPAFSFQAIDPSAGNELAYAWFLPTYTAAAWYHHKLKGELAGALTTALDSAEQFVRGDYSHALLEGDRLSGEERHRLAARLSELTSLPASYLAQRKLRLDPGQFEGRLLVDDDRSVGRYDSRIKGIVYEPGDNAGYDPSYEAVAGAFAAGFNDYVRSELKFESDLPYELIGNVSPWKFPEGQYLDAAETLRHAMVKNRHLKAWILSGYYDLAVPYFTAQQVMHEMSLDPEIHANIRQTLYQGGHMMYTVTTELSKMKRDYAEWLKSATAG